MKFRLTFKTPDVLDTVLAEHSIVQAINLTSRDHGEEGCEHGALPDCVVCEQAVETAMEARKAIRSIANKFIQFGECITIEFDTDNGTATVVPVK